MSSKPSSCESCALAGKSRGFCLGVGDPVTAKLAFVLEATSDAEVGFFLNTPSLDIVPDPRAEVLRRQATFPLMERSAIIKGVPASGRAGSILNNWLFPKVGIVRSEVFVDSTLRCCPPKAKTGKPYPTGKDKNGAEFACRQYDRLRDFRPDAIVLTFHPSVLMGEVTVLPLVLKDLEKAQSFVKQGLRTLVLMGGHAAEVFLGYGSNVARWRGHYELTASRGGPDAWYERVLARTAARAKVGGGKRKSKAAQLAAGNAAVLGDGLDIKAPKVRKKPGCKAVVADEAGATYGVCGETKDAHPTPACAKYVSGRKKKAHDPSADKQKVVLNRAAAPTILCLDEKEAKGQTATHAPSTNALHQLCDGEVESPGDSAQHVKANLPSGIFNSGDVGPGKAGSGAELLLGPSPGVP